VSEVAQTPLENVEGQVHLCVPEMRSVVGRDATRIERHHLSWFEGNDLGPCSVIEVHGHD
jgi:hypothetical protein